MLDEVVGSFGRLRFGRMEEEHHQEEGKGMFERGMILEGRDTKKKHMSKRPEEEGWDTEEEHLSRRLELEGRDMEEEHQH
jgi:hypothetical protein